GEQATRPRDEVARARRDPVTGPGARARGGLDRLDQRSGRVSTSSTNGPGSTSGQAGSRQARPTGQARPAVRPGLDKLDQRARLDQRSGRVSTSSTNGQARPAARLDPERSGQSVETFSDIRATSPSIHDENPS